MNNAFIEALTAKTESEWLAALGSLLPSIHEVDRNAVQIWFRFYPLSLYRYLSNAEDLDQAKRGLAMQGSFGLEDKIDTSHRFLYGHRFWPAVKSSVEKAIDAGQGDEKLEDLIRRLATDAAATSKADVSLLIGITAAALMTLVQVGADKFRAASGKVDKPKGTLAHSPEAVLKSRREDDSQGLFGFLKTVDRKFSIIHDENSPRDKFPVVNDQEIASASANDRSQDWQARDERCWEGPVPVECTSAACGTCWIGVIAGQEKLSEVSPRERRAMKVFGYKQPDEERPFLRLACQARAAGNATIVIPPWNAVFGKKVYGNVEELELEPVTTSAKRLRETIAEATSPEPSN
jgi:ferredoxin